MTRRLAHRLAIAVAVAVAGCSVSAGGSSSEPGPLGSEAEGGSTRVEEDDPHDGGTKRDAAKNDAATADAAQAFASDPLNCGGPAHDCRGATCVGGVCTPEEIAFVDQTLALTHHANELFMLHAASSGNYELARCGKKPGATVQPIGDAHVPSASLTVELGVGGGFAYYLGRVNAGDTIHRVPISGATLPDESISFFGEHIAVDDTRLTFTTSIHESFTRAHTASSDSAFPSTTDARYGSLGLFDTDGTSLFALVGDKVYEVPFATGASNEVASLSNVGGFSSGFAATKHAFYGVHFQGSNPVACETTSFNVWRAPRQAGAAPSVILGSAGWVPRIQADDLGAFYTLRPCNGGDASIVAHREDGVSYTVATHSSGQTPVFTFDDDYVYYVDLGKLYRAAR